MDYNSQDEQTSSAILWVVGFIAVAIGSPIVYVIIRSITEGVK